MAPRKARQLTQGTPSCQQRKSGGRRALRCPLRNRNFPGQPPPGGPVDLVRCAPLSARTPHMPIADSVKLGDDVKIFHPTQVNLYGCSIGKGSKVGSFVEIQKNATVGERCKISSHTFICEGVTIEDEVFIGHGVMFTNDVYPRAANDDGSAQSEADWKVVPTLVKRRASIGSNATIMGGVTIGTNAL